MTWPEKLGGRPLLLAGFGSLLLLMLEACGYALRTLEQVRPSDLGKHMDSIRKLAEPSVNIILNRTPLLRPSMLDDFGLAPAVEWQAREVSKRTGIRVQVAAADSAGELPDARKTCIYRVVQEALHNCARHAQARSVRVVVRHDGRGSMPVAGSGIWARHFMFDRLPGLESKWMWSRLLRVEAGCDARTRACATLVYA